jgi:hypothetical protein
MDNLIMQIAQASRLQTLALNRLKALLTEIVGNAERSAVSTAHCWPIKKNAVTQKNVQLS